MVHRRPGSVYIISFLLGLSLIIITGCLSARSVLPGVVTEIPTGKAVDEDAPFEPTITPSLPEASASATDVVSEPTPTLTPAAPVFPVGNGQVIPDVEYEVLSAANISQIQPIAQYGQARWISVSHDPGQKYFFITKRDGIEVRDFNSKTLIRTISTRIRAPKNADTRYPNAPTPTISFDGDNLLLFTPEYDLELWDVNGDKLWTKSMAWKGKLKDGEQVSNLWVDISSDGNKLAQSYCVENKCQVIVSDTSTDEVLADVDGSTPMFSVSGRYLFFYRDVAISFYDLTTGKITQNIPISKNQVSNYHLQNVGIQDDVALVTDQRVSIIDPESGKTVSILVDWPDFDLTGYLPTVEFSSDGKFAAVFSYELDKNSSNYVLEHYPLLVNTYQTESGQKIKESEYKRYINYWMTSTGDLDSVVLEENNPIPDLAYGSPSSPFQLVFDTDTPVLYGKVSSFIRREELAVKVYKSLLECKKGECTQTDLDSTTSYSRYYQDGKWIELSGDPKTMRFDLMIDGKKVKTIREFFTHLRVMGMAGDNLIYSTTESCADKGVNFVDIPTWSNISEAEPDGSGDFGTTYGISDSYIVGQIVCPHRINDGIVIIYDRKSGEVIYRLESNSDVLFQPIDQNQSVIMVESVPQFKVDLLDLKTFKIQSIVNPTPDVKSWYMWPDRTIYGSIHPDETIYAFSDMDGKAYIFDTAINQIIFSWVPQTARINAIQFSADGKFLATFGEDGLLTVWGIPAK